VDAGVRRNNEISGFVDVIANNLISAEVLFVCSVINRNFSVAKHLVNNFLINVNEKDIVTAQEYVS